MINLIYYALMYNVTNLAGDIFVNHIANVVFETIGLLLPIFILDRFGRRKIFAGSVVLGGLCCVASIFPVLFGWPG